MRPPHLIPPAGRGPTQNSLSLEGEGQGEGEKV